MKWFLLTLLGCASVPDSEQHHNPIVQQILRARNGKLSNAACSPKDDKKCIPEIVYYDIEDAGVRKVLTDAKFFCNVAGRLFHVCPNYPGLCRKGEPIVVRRFLGIPVERRYPEEIIDQGSQFDVLSVVCRSILK